MKIFNSLLNTSAVALLSLLAPVCVNAVEYSTGTVTDIASMRLHSDWSYTHKIDFKKPGGGASLINGVQFNEMTRYWDAASQRMILTPLPNFTIKSDASSADSIGDFSLAAGRNPFPASDASLNKFFTGYFQDWSGGWKYTDTLTLTGLEVGKSYELRIYYLSNLSTDNATQTITFGNGVQTLVSTLNPNTGEDVMASYIQYDYTASNSTVTVKFKQNFDGKAMNFVGLTNLDVASIPEASSIAMLAGVLAVAVVGLRMRRLKR